MSRIVLTTFGSLGDLHPYIAVGAALRARGHDVVLASHPGYRSRVEAEGLAFAPVGPDYEALGDLASLMREAMDERRGSEVVMRRFVLPYVRTAHAELLETCRGADLLVDHFLVLGAPLVAEELRIPRVSCALQPVALFSAYDPPVMPAAPWLSSFGVFGPPFWRMVWGLARVASQGWFREVAAIRAERGLSPLRGHPLFDGASDALHLVLFSRELMAPQPDWPRASVQTGFPLHDRGVAGEGTPPALARWLDAGEPPLVFTLGSSAVYSADRFYEHARDAARALGRRAVLIVGLDGINRVPGVPDVSEAPGARIVTVPYAPHSEIMPRACANVHQGGVGTTMQAMRAGVPMLVVPFSHDQPDNAQRCRRLGIARVLPRSQASAATFERELRALLADTHAAASASAVAARMRTEPGAAGAADAIERLLATGGSASRPA